MNMPACRIDEIENRIDEGTATAEDIRLYVDYKAEMARHEAETAARKALVESDIQARIEKDREQAGIAHLELVSLAQDAMERLKAVNG